MNPSCNNSPSIESPIANMAAVTPNDAVNLTNFTRGLYVGATGDVKVTTLNGNAVTMVGLAAGVWHPIRVSRVWATGTTATGIVAGW